MGGLLSKFKRKSPASGKIRHNYSPRSYECYQCGLIPNARVEALRTSH